MQQPGLAFGDNIPGPGVPAGLFVTPPPPPSNSLLLEGDQVGYLLLEGDQTGKLVLQ